MQNDLGGKGKSSDIMTAFYGSDTHLSTPNLPPCLPSGVREALVRRIPAAAVVPMLRHVDRSSPQYRTRLGSCSK